MTFKYEHKIKMYSLGVYVARQNQLKFFGVDSTYLTDAEKSKIVETLLIGSPFPPVIMFERDFDTVIIKNGNLIKVLIEFVNNKIQLINLEIASKYNDYFFYDFIPSEQKRILNKTIATYMLSDIPIENEVEDIVERFETTKIQDDYDLINGDDFNSAPKFLEFIANNNNKKEKVKYKSDFKTTSN